MEVKKIQRCWSNWVITDPHLNLQNFVKGHIISGRPATLPKKYALLYVPKQYIEAMLSILDPDLYSQYCSRSESRRAIETPVFRIRIGLNADPDPGFYLNSDPDSGFWTLKTVIKWKFWNKKKNLYCTFNLILVDETKELIQHLTLLKSSVGDPNPNPNPKGSERFEGSESESNQTVRIRIRIRKDPNSNFT